MNDKLANALAEIAEKLNLSTQHLWPELVKYTYYKALMGACAGVLFAVVSLLLAFRANRFLREKAIAYDAVKKEYADNGWWVGLYIMWGIECALLLLCLNYALGAIPVMLAPEAATADGLLRGIR